MMRNVFLSLVVAASLPAVAAEKPDLPQLSSVAHAPREFVRGGQFKDLILPMPIVDGLESEGIWGDPNVLPRDRDSGIEDNEWCYWGGNPVKGKDGKYHMAICRWPENTGHMGWFESEVAHCVSDSPTGPYKPTKTIVTKGHNPEVMCMPDGTFALHVMNASVYAAEHMPGPWKRIGSMRLDSRGMRSSDRLGSNLTTEFRPDGSVLLMRKNGGDLIVGYALLPGRSTSAAALITLPVKVIEKRRRAAQLGGMRYSGSE